MHKSNVNLIVDEVVNVNDHRLELASEETVSFKKLVLATDFTPFALPIKGIDKRGVWFVKKQKEYLERMKEELKKATTVVVIGGGFIGMEITDELLKAGKKVYLIDKLPSLLPLSMDKEFGDKAKEILKSLRAKVLTGMSVEEITGSENVDGVVLNNGSRISTDAVVVAVGYGQNLDLAKKSELAVDDNYGVVVDEF